MRITLKILVHRKLYQIKHLKLYLITLLFLAILMVIQNLKKIYIYIQDVFRLLNKLRYLLNVTYSMY